MRSDTCPDWALAILEYAQQLSVARQHWGACDMAILEDPDRAWEEYERSCPDLRQVDDDLTGYELTMQIWLQDGYQPCVPDSSKSRCATHNGATFSGAAKAHHAVGRQP